MSPLSSRSPSLSVLGIARVADSDVVALAYLTDYHHGSTNPLSTSPAWSGC